MYTVYNDLYHIADEAVWSDEENNLEFINKAKSLIKDGANVNKALSLCVEKLKYHAKIEKRRGCLLDGALAATLGEDWWHTVDELLRTPTDEQVSEIKAHIVNASDKHNWILKIVNLIEQEKIDDALIRVSVKKELPMQSVNKNILSYLR